MKFRYYVSYFLKLRMDDTLGIKMQGHIETGVFEISHPLTTKEEVDRFVQFLQNREKQKNLFEVQLIAFSLMYVVNPEE